MNVKYLFVIYILTFSFISCSYENVNSGKAQNNNNSYQKLKVVFIGNSITYNWGNDERGFFRINSYINKGISGETTKQMLDRFNNDVIKLCPNIVIINGGTNDIPGHISEYVEDNTVKNIISMVEISHDNNILVILSSVLPGKNDNVLQLTNKILSLNAKIKKVAEENDCIYVDYYSFLSDENGFLKQEYAKDDIHPNTYGYKVMEELISDAINNTLAEI